MPIPNLHCVTLAYSQFLLKAIIGALSFRKLKRKIMTQLRPFNFLKSPLLPERLMEEGCVNILPGKQVPTMA